MNDIRTVIQKHTREKAIEEAVRREIVALSFARYHRHSQLFNFKVLCFLKTISVNGRTHLHNIRSEFRKIMSGA